MPASIQQAFAATALLCLSSLMVIAHPVSRKSSESNQTRRVILWLEQQGREATLKNDVEANDRLLAEDWLNVNPDGSVTTKDELMKLIKAGTFKISSVENDEVLVRTFGDTAVVTGLSTTKRAGRDNETISRQVRFTRVYARIRGRWQVVSAHNTLVSQP